MLDQPSQAQGRWSIDFGRAFAAHLGAGNFAEPEAVAAFGSLIGIPAVTMPIPTLLSFHEPSRRALT